LKLRHLLMGLCLSALIAPKTQAQDYKNIVNTRFNTVASGPMDAVIVDVPNGADAATIDKAIAAKVNGARLARRSTLMREISILRQTFHLKGEIAPGIADIVYVRQNGKLILPQSKGLGRAEGPNDIDFVFPITAAASDGGWTQAQHDELVAVKNIMYVALKTVYGDPSWSGTVTVINGDNTTSIPSDPNVISGGIYDISNKKIIFAQYNSIQSKVLNLTQMMAIAFHGPDAISYDAWERGMARAATLESVRSAIPALNGTFGNNSVDPADPLWQAMDRYDLLNQPPLGNDRFFPVSKTNGVANEASFPLLLIPRLTMSGTAWLKALAETPSFLRNFNTAYYAAFTTDPTVKNNIPALKQLASQALAGAQIEGLSFTDWYQRQFVLDTSVSPGTKLYAFVLPLRPDPADDKDDFGYGVVLYYFQTTFDTSGNSDEVSLNGTSYPIYWDYTYTNRLFLAAQYERVDIRNGIGTVAPTFFATIGGDPNLNGQMRVTMDFPVNSENVRLYVAPRNMGKVQTTSGTVGYFYGAVVGMDTGKVQITTDTGANATFDVKQGSFGGALDPSALSRPTRATLTVLDSTNAQVGQRKVNIGYTSNSDPNSRLQEYESVLYVNDPVTSLTHTFPVGPAMISFPIQPLKPRAGDALLNPTNDLPLFNDGNLLLAEWRQNLNKADGDNYLRYPSLDPLKPGKGYWENFGGDTDVKITGRTTTLDQDLSLGLLHGWNQIGTPYNSPVNVSDLQFQYLADNVPVDLATAISKGYIVAQNVPGAGQVAVWEYTTASGYIPATTLQPWKGYWIRVLVSEGVTITYPNPTGPSRSIMLSRGIKRAAPVAVSGWAIPLSVRGTDGTGGTAYLGQSDQAVSGYDAKLDAMRPPEFTRAVPTVSFPHPEWGANAGNYFSDIHGAGSRDPWTVAVYAPNPTRSYTLTWSSLTNVPRTTRLILVDMATGKRQYMQSSSGYSFVPGNSPTRQFQILTEERTRGSLQIMNIVARQSRGAATIEMSYDLTQGATVTTEIKGLDGRTIRRLVPGRAAASGTNNVIWDGRDEKAASVASGSYLVNITARSPEGETARAIRMITVVR
jgi:hypothetical protein